MSTATIETTTDQATDNGPLNVGTIQVPVHTTEATVHEIQFEHGSALVIPIVSTKDFADAWDHFSMSVRSNDAAVFVAPVAGPITLESLEIDPYLYQVFDVVTGCAVLVVKQPSRLLAKHEAKQLLQRGGRPAVISPRFPVREWEEELPTEITPGGRRKGSVSRHVEFVGKRSGMDFAELLYYGDDLGALRDLFGSENSINVEWRGCDEYRIIQPGETRPWCVVETKATQSYFLGKTDIDEFVDKWIADFDQKTGVEVNSNDDDQDPEEERKQNPIGYDLRVTADDYDEMADDVKVVRESLTKSLTGDTVRIEGLLYSQEESMRQMANLCRSMMETYSVAGLNGAYVMNDSLQRLSSVVGELIRDSKAPAVVSRLHHYVHMKICFEMRGCIRDAIREAGEEIARQTR
ncbi:hypothetical protein [Neorhodopirellula pilleata]|uniref:Uncharacterized protein n=1 Tax=Neorhodopirellula pilleata TaxID=2714738 RepID=A0A5C5ZLC3_9BACT|nr:hypothetical protein [Neorhodopirellula pilleata]TWT87998.1 hypothetical protein Pla100_57280 [Neorhodopirellula pilleata]